MKAIVKTVLLVITTIVPYCTTQLPCDNKPPMCIDCNHYSECSFRMENGKFVIDYNEPVECYPGFVCDQYNAACVRNGICRYEEFKCPTKCEEEAIYPDPYFCLGYYGCEGEDVYKYTCDNGFAFDPITLTCSKEINDTACIEYPIFCNVTGFKGKYGKFDYTCEGSNPIYPRFEGVCIDNSTVGPTVPPTKPSNTTSQPPTTTSQPPTTTSQPPKQQCTETGIFPNKTDCTKYYTCQKDGNKWIMKEGQCRPGTFFDPKRLTCRPGVCNNETTTTPSTSSTTTTTTTPSSSSTLSSTTTPGYDSCTEEGIFPDAKNCTCYIKCIPTSGAHFNQIHECCRRGSYFLPGRNICIPGKC